MTVTPELVKQLRDMTGAGMMDCRKALTESDGNIDAAMEYLQKKGQASAHKKSGRIAAEGIVDAYIHAGGKMGVLLEVNCESDFVSRNEDFRALVHDLCLHIAAANPRYVRADEVPAEERATQMRIFVEQARESGKPEKILEKIAQGRMDKWLAEICLVDQPFVKDPDKTVAELVKEKIGTIGENITIRRFVRYQMGEGLQKREHNLLKDLEEMRGQQG